MLIILLRLSSKQLRKFVTDIKLLHNLSPPADNLIKYLHLIIATICGKFIMLNAHSVINGISETCEANRNRATIHYATKCDPIIVQRDTSTVFFSSR